MNKLREIPIPPGPVEAVVGRAFTQVDGSRRVEYATASGDRYVCITDGVSRQWYEVVATSTKETP